MHPSQQSFRARTTLSTTTASWFFHYQAEALSETPEANSIFLVTKPRKVRLFCTGWQGLEKIFFWKETPLNEKTVTEPISPDQEITSLSLLSLNKTIKTACASCPNSMWFGSEKDQKCFCRIMHVVTWSDEVPNIITHCDGQFLDNWDRRRETYQRHISHTVVNHSA